MDGPRDLHDTYRVDKGGKGTFDQVMRGWDMLRKHGVEFNILCTVHAANVEQPVEVYRFFRDVLNAKFIQFIPIDKTTDRSVRPEQFGQFLVEIFEEWLRRDVGTLRHSVIRFKQPVAVTCVRSIRATDG